MTQGPDTGNEEGALAGRKTSLLTCSVGSHLMPQSHKGMEDTNGLCSARCEQCIREGWGRKQNKSRFGRVCISPDREMGCWRTRVSNKQGNSKSTHKAILRSAITPCCYELLRWLWMTRAAPLFQTQPEYQGCASSAAVMCECCSSLVVCHRTQTHGCSGLQVAMVQLCPRAQFGPPGLSSVGSWVQVLPSSMSLWESIRSLLELCVCLVAGKAHCGEL